MTVVINKRLGLALTASLAFNLFLGGALLGGWLGGPAGGVQTVALQPTPGYSVAEFLGTLPPDGWAAAERSMGARRGDINARIAALQRARGQVSSALARHPLDPAAVDAAFEELRRRSQGVQSSLHGVIIDMAGHLAPRDRAYMARGLFLFSGPDNDSRIALHRVPLM